MSKLERMVLIRSFLKHLVTVYNYVWLFLEIHMRKIVLISVILLCVNDVSFYLEQVGTEHLIPFSHSGLCHQLLLRPCRCTLHQLEEKTSDPTDQLYGCDCSDTNSRQNAVPD